MPDKLSCINLDEATKQNNTYWSNQVEVQRREVAAWVAQVSGKSAEAFDQIRSAVEREESMDKHAVTPGAVTPAREMLGEMLMLEKHPKDALAEYEAVLKTTPSRFNALCGAATAADMSGDVSASARYFQKLLEVGVGDECPELKTARQKIAISARK